MKKTISILKSGFIISHLFVSYTKLIWRQPVLRPSVDERLIYTSWIKAHLTSLSLCMAVVGNWKTNQFNWMYVHTSSPVALTSDNISMVTVVELPGNTTPKAGKIVNIPRTSRILVLCPPPPPPPPPMFSLLKINRS